MPAPIPAPDAAVAPFDAWCRQALATVASTSRPSRSDVGAPGFEAAAFAQADLLEVQFADGSVYYTAPQEFAALHPGPALPRAAEAAPGRVGLAFDLTPSQAASRAAADDAAQVAQYRLVQLTPRSPLDLLYDRGALVLDGLDRWFGTPQSPRAGALAGQICRAYEDQVLDGRLGATNGLLLQWSAAGWLPVDAAALQAVQAVQAGQAAQAQPVLLLLHGTASSTQGSFSGLWQPGSSAAGQTAEDFDRLAQGRVVLAFEHRSLTASPLRNLLDLLRALQPLPAGCRLSLLSHSRGGLVGEGLSLVLGSADAAPESALGRVQAGLTALAAAYPDEHPDQPLLAELGTQLTQAAGRWQAGSFVRVACPARGTLLADRRTDLYLSLLLRGLGLALGAANPAVEALGGLVRALVASRADARSLPGLEAMIPGAPLSVALNSVAGSFPGRLRVVAGDSQAAGWQGLLTLLGDVFYGLHDHDFVVHTHSMFGGLLRADARSLRVEDGSVTHFGYFKPGSLTRQPILAALAGVDTGFRPMAEDEARTRGWLQLLDPDPLSRRPRAAWLAALAQAQAPRRPILVVLPGIMGSELATDARDAGAPVWLSTLALLRGQLRLLDLAVGDGLVATGMMALSYERLLEAASQRYHVVTFAFDWRKPVTDAGDALFTLLRDTLLPRARALGVAVHLMAHSMGGLVARAALFHDSRAAERAALWRELCNGGGRLLLLGTPNQGSYAPVQLLLQQHRLGQLVGAAAAKVTAADLARWGAAFPGLMAMLPAEPDPVFGNLFAADSWATMQGSDKSVTLPDKDVLRKAAVLRTWLSNSFEALRQDSRVLYVAGQGVTPLGLKVINGAGAGGGTTGLTGKVLRLGATQRGDGTVPWNSTLLPERTWYVACGHGELLDQAEAFDAYFELLAQGRSSRLSQQPPATRSIDEASALMPLQALPSLPAEPAAYVLGLAQARAAGPRTAPIELSVVHGSLDYARFPLMVGHYHNDGVFGAVQRVDAKLDGQLSRALRLKLFEGDERTSVYLRPATAQAQPAYRGAIVLGLGTLGALTPASLADTVTRGVLRYAYEHVFKDPWVAPVGPLTLDLSALLIGTHVQAVTPRDSLAGVLQGVWRAGQILADDQLLGRSVRVGRLELVEIEESVALDAAYELRRLLARQEWQPRMRWAAQTLETRDGGLRGFKPSQPESIWQRLVVRQDELGGLKFELIAERARVESTQVSSDVASLHQYIGRVSDEGASRRASVEEQASLGRVLYQLLLPQALKSRLANFENTVLVLDDKSAALPWELLTPPRSDALGAESTRPLAVQAGMVRQRTTFEFRQLPQAVEGWGALVVGAPSTEAWHDDKGEPMRFADLPGAVAEAQEVVDQLGNDAGRRWEIKALPAGSSFERVRTALLEQAWRVLHLCGHGVVDQWVSSGVDGPPGAERRVLRKTGMLLSHQQILTAADVEQMDPAPEFVFINCCYSGRDGEAPSAGVRHNHPLLASSLALQFIKMGAKAVVAAGWRVDDADGLAFAQRLYACLLSGLGFGAAVREARNAIHGACATGQRSNTWGAYQCYGDPEWRLASGPARAEAAPAAGSGRLRGAALCMSEHELAVRILQVVSVAGDKAADALVRQLDGLIQALQRDPLRSAWLGGAGVRVALGEAYRELGDHRQALAWFKASGRSAYSSLQLRHIEQAANSLARLQHPQGHAGARQVLDLLDRIDAIADDELGLPALAGEQRAASAASERLCLRGSDALRQAADPDPTRSSAQRARTLFDAALLFGSGYLAKLDPPDLSERQAYALSCAMLAAGLSARLHGSRRKQVAAGAWLLGSDGLAVDWQAHTDALITEMARADRATAFWHYTNRLELLVARNVLRLALGQPVDPRELEIARELIDLALVRWPAPVELESLKHRFALIAELVKPASAPAAAPTDAQRVADTAHWALRRIAEHRPGGGG